MRDSTPRIIRPPAPRPNVLQFNISSLTLIGYEARHDGRFPSSNASAARPPSLMPGGVLTPASRAPGSLLGLSDVPPGCPFATARAMDAGWFLHVGSAVQALGVFVAPSRAQSAEKVRSLRSGKLPRCGGAGAPPFTTRSSLPPAYAMIPRPAGLPQSSQPGPPPQRAGWGITMGRPASGACRSPDRVRSGVALLANEASATAQLPTLGWKVPVRKHPDSRPESAPLCRYRARSERLRERLRSTPARFSRETGGREAGGVSTVPGLRLRFSFVRGWALSQRPARWPPPSLPPQSIQSDLWPGGFRAGPNGLPLSPLKPRPAVTSASPHVRTPQPVLNAPPQVLIRFVRPCHEGPARRYASRWRCEAGRPALLPVPSHKSSYIHCRPTPGTR